MQTLEINHPPTSSASYSADGLVKETPRLYDTPMQYTGVDMPTPYGLDDTKKHHHHRRNPHRKYSRQWWGTAWDISVEVGKWPRIAYFVFGLILVIVWIVVMTTFANDEVKHERANLQGNIKHSSAIAGQLFVKGVLRKFDPDDRILTVQWSLWTFDNDSQAFVPLGSTPNNSYPFNIYQDVKAVPEDRTPPNPNTTFVPSDNYRIDNVTLAPIAVLGQHDWDSVDTDIDFTQSKANDAWRQPLFAYPFDEWSGSIVLAATDRPTAQLVGLNNTAIVEISGAFLGDETLNWLISLNANDTCQVEAVFAGCEMHIDFTGRRPGLVKFACIVAVIVNWTSTIGIFLLTCEAVVMKRNYILRDMDILGVCLTALFALPSVRAILPGAPDFGAIIDLIGIIPNVIIISLCTTTFALNKLLMKRPKDDKDD